MEAVTIRTTARLHRAPVTCPKTFKSRHFLPSGAHSKNRERQGLGEYKCSRIGVLTASIHTLMHRMQGLGARSRRDLLRKTWVPQGKLLRDLEDEKSVVIRFVVGYRCAAAHLCPSLTRPADSIYTDVSPLVLRIGSHAVPAP